MSVIQSVVTERLNGDLIEYVQSMYIHADVPVLDLTYGKGNFWTKYRPSALVTNDLDPEKGEFHYSYEEPLPGRWHGQFGVVVFDPPYVVKGGRETSGIQDFDERFGLRDAPRTVPALFDEIQTGIVYGADCLTRGGFMLVKVMDFIYAGKYRSGYQAVCEGFRVAGLQLEDVFVHHSGIGPQPTTNPDGSPRRQVHSRRAHSYLMVGKA